MAWGAEDVRVLVPVVVSAARGQMGGTSITSSVLSPRTGDILIHDHPDPKGVSELEGKIVNAAETLRRLYRE